MDILGGLGLELDELRMMERSGLNKNSRIISVLESLPQANMIDIYDDDMGNIEMFLSLKKKLIQKLIKNILLSRKNAKILKAKLRIALSLESTVVQFEKLCV